ncbi:TonB-dependent receptor plug domain-containing protein [Sphingomonas sp.]|uniref:TonB-dependent receptor plug domain-containing protein n=1 Tax=Sphingomonas sp. TaxID=28214 RepID=UPI003B00CA81
MLDRFAVRTLALGAALAPALVAAQTSNQAASPAITGAPTAADAASKQTKGDEIVVTGSRIARTEFAAPNPIVSFNAAAIEQSGNTNITNFLQRVPALTGSRDSTQSAGGNAVSRNPPFGQAGLNNLNLRNLGTDRTLVLVNGRRHVAGSPNTAAVDINSIPTDLIQSVDVLTGGASAVYGADGVSGVVNFILKRNYDGISARTQMGVSSRGDGANKFVSIIAGRNFAGDRGNVTLGYEYNRDERVENDDRSYLRQNRRRYLIPNDADVNGDPNIPDNVLVGDLRYPAESPLGSVFIGAEANPRFDGLGRAYDNGTPAAYYGTGGVNTGVAGFYSGDLFPQIERHDVNLLAHYDFSDAFKLSFEGKYAQTRAKTFDYFTGTYYYPIALDNPFIPAAVRDAAALDGSDSVHVNRDNLDYGRHGERDLRRTYRAVIDAAGRISDHATYDVYYEYGRTTARITKLNDRLNDRYVAALDAVTDPATGRPTCRSNLDPTALLTPAVTFTPGANSGCVPVSLFGAGPASAAALAFFRTNDTSHARVTQQVADASVSGDFGQFFSLPGGPVQFSFGGEYRRESSSFQPSTALLNALFFPGDEPSLVTPSGGHFDVKEAFGELNAPILKDVPFAQTLAVGAAGRYSHYSTVGDTKTWQVNGVYAPIRDITFRGSYGKAVRAPNIGELFQPTTGSSEFFIDPCTPDEIGNGTQYRAGNCATSLAAVGASVSPSLQTGNNIIGSLSGNTGLKAETARTWTGGVVLRPRFIRGFTVSVDWYDIKLRNAINTVAAAQLASLCVDQPTLDNAFCGSITRARGTGIINGFRLRPENVAAFRTSGADLNLDYAIRTARVGTFDIRLVGGYLHKLDFVGIPGADVMTRLDTFLQPRWNGNFSPTWTMGRVTVNYNFRFTDGVRLTLPSGAPAPAGYAPDNLLRYSPLLQHDLQVQVETANGFAFYTGVTNLTDQKPDPGNSTNNPISPLGRFLYVGAKVSLGGKS